MKILFKKVCIASDHGGFNLKEIIKDRLIKKNISIIDLGPLENKTVDYPDYAKKLASRTGFEVIKGLNYELDSTSRLFIKSFRQKGKKEHILLLQKI